MFYIEIGLCDCVGIFTSILLPSRLEVSESDRYCDYYLGITRKSIYQKRKKIRGNYFILRLQMTQKIVSGLEPIV